MNRTELPHSFEAEEALLGGLLLNPDQLAWLDVDEDEFHNPRYRVVFAAMRRVADKRLAVDPVTVEAELRHDGKLEAIGGMAFLGQLMLKVPTAENTVHYAELLRRRRIERDLVTAMGEATASILGGRAIAEGAELLDEVVAELGRIEVGKKRSRRTLFDAVVTEQLRVLSPQRDTPGLPTGIPRLDRATGGVPRGTTLVIGGRPGGGKSALAAIQIAATVALEVGPVLVGTWEDRDTTLGRRGLSRLSGVAGKRIRLGDLDMWEQNAVAAAVPPDAWKRIYIEHMHGRPIDEFCRLARSYIRGEGVVLLVGDYIQRMRPPRALRGADTNKIREAVVNEWDELVGSENVGGLLLSQLTRECVREGRAPRPDDLRDSGAIEQVAKQIWMLHESKRDGDEILVLKDSGGEVGHIAVDFDRVSMTFRERAEQRPGGLHADDD